MVLHNFTECLVKLHDYWASDIAFSLTLLSQFLEDMEAYAEVRLAMEYLLMFKHFFHGFKYLGIWSKNIHSCTTISL